jgi:CubicO group peptidase (beta-lactamase class C family)
MELSRRTLIISGCGGAGFAWLQPFPAWAAALSGPAPDLTPIVERVRAFAEADLREKGLPGMQIALVGPGGAEATLAVGLADLDARIPAAPGQLFQIGSISKSLTAMAILVLAERGRLDLDARAKDLLPEIPLPPEPITVAQLLEHSSGLPNGAGESLFPQVPGGRFWTGFPPGSRFSYCNTGYNLLGHIVARTSRMPFDRALRTLVLEPIGMRSARPVIRMADRAAYATGHARLREDMPWLPRARLTEARWMDFTDAAGSVGATASDMLRYLRFIIQVGRGKGAPLFSDAAAQRYRSPTIDTNLTGEQYGYGLRHRLVDERPALGHTGGMIGFSSAFTVDPAAGVGVYASVNVGGAGGYRPVELNNYALAMLRAAAIGSPLPDPRTRAEPTIPEGLHPRVIGQWRSADGSEMMITGRAGRLFVSSGGVERPLVPAGNALVTDHPALSPYVLSHIDDPRPAILIGDRLFGRDRAPAIPAVPPRVAVLAGTYFTPQAWTSHAPVHAVGDRLYLRGAALREASDGSWRFVDPALASERVWFENYVDGRPQTLNFSGVHFLRQSVS